MDWEAATCLAEVVNGVDVSAVVEQVDSRFEIAALTRVVQRCFAPLVSHLYVGAPLEHEAQDLLQARCQLVPIERRTVECQSIS